MPTDPLAQLALCALATVCMAGVAWWAAVLGGEVWAVIRGRHG